MRKRKEREEEKLLPNKKSDWSHIGLARYKKTIIIPQISGERRF